MMKKTKNYIRIVAVLLAVVTVFTVPVSADSFSSSDFQFIDLLDYGLPNGGPYTAVNPGTVTFDVPVDLYEVCYVDLVVYCPSSPTFVCNGSTLQTVPIGSWLYRVFGSVSYFCDSTFSMTFGGAAYADFYQVLICPTTLSFRRTSSCDLSLTYRDNNYDAIFKGSPVSVSVPTADILDGSRCNYHIDLTDWFKYDYMAVSFTILASSIDSVNVNLDDYPVPFEISYLNLNASDEGSSSGVGSNYVNVQLLLDFTNIARSTSVCPQIVINSIGAGSSFLTLYGCEGWVSYNFPDSYEYFLSCIVDSNNLILEEQRITSQRIYNGFGNLIQFLDVNVKNYFIDLRDTLSDRLYTHFTNLINTVDDFQESMETWFTTVRDLMITQYDNMVTYLTGKFKAVTDRLDKLIGGTSEGDELSQGAADLEDQAGDIHDFEQSQQAVLDNNFDAIQGAVTFTGFTAALAFVQRYINFSWSGIQGFSVIYTLPIFIGLFFFVCGRIPGATRWRSRPPKDGGSA